MCLALFDAESFTRSSLLNRLHFEVLNGLYYQIGLVCPTLADAVEFSQGEISWRLERVRPIISF